MPELRRAALVLFALGASATGYTIDHSNLDAGRPVQLEDAYPIEKGEWALEVGAGASHEREAANQGRIDAELLYGLLLNLHVGVGTSLFTEPDSLGRGQERSGDLRLSTLYNLNQESRTLPALGVKAEVTLPTGDGSEEAGVQVTGLLTKSIARLALHLNAGAEFQNEAPAEERDWSYLLALGASYPLGAPRNTLTTLVGDVVLRQDRVREESETVTMELGLRRQFSQRFVLDIGASSDVSGAEQRSRFALRAGVSLAF